MSENLYHLFQEIDRTSKTKGKDTYVRAPFGYPGGKSRSLDFILPHLPLRHSYVEVFGGSGTVLLNRSVSELEVYNDRYGGVVAFYRCIRDPFKLDALIDRLYLTLHSREEWIWCADTWESLVTDDVERAARWFYMHFYSFSNKGGSWGRQTKSKSMAGKVRDRLPLFPTIHTRLRNVQIENLDWRECMGDYASPETVFYHDPPYLYEGSSKIYKHSFKLEDHRQLIEAVFKTPGFHAISGYSHPLYEERPWDERHQWETWVSIGGNAYSDGNNKADLRTKGIQNKRAVEVLWIKDNR